jgi:hypothetical protein
MAFTTHLFVSDVSRPDAVEPPVHLKPLLLAVVVVDVGRLSTMLLNGFSSSPSLGINKLAC